MNDAVMQDMSKSMNILKIAEPIIIDLLNGGKMLPVEGSDDDICKFLDTSCGCDYFHVYDKTNLTWGVASRFQKCYARTYDTFTVRLERASGAMTEYENVNTLLSIMACIRFLQCRDIIIQIRTRS